MALSAAAITGIVGAASSIVGSGINAISSGKMNKRGARVTARENEKARQHSWDMWNATNDFNLMTSNPAFQMQRFKDAGMNPWLIYGDPKPVTANSVGAPSNNAPAPNVPKFDLSEAFQNFMMAQMQKKQLDKIDAEINDINASQANKDASTQAIVQDTNQKAQLFGGQLDMQSASINNMNTQSQKLLSEIEKIGMDTNKSAQEIANMKANVGKTLVEIDNLRKQGKILEAEAEAKELSNKIIRETADNKIEAENTINRRTIETKGLNNQTGSGLVGTILGYTIKTLQDYDKQGNEEKMNWENIKSGWKKARERDKQRK